MSFGVGQLLDVVISSDQWLPARKLSQVGGVTNNCSPDYSPSFKLELIFFLAPVELVSPEHLQICQPNGSFIAFKDWKVKQESINNVSPCVQDQIKKPGRYFTAIISFPRFINIFAWVYLHTHRCLSN
jgi:hypothetical protein